MIKHSSITLAGLIALVVNLYCQTPGAGTQDTVLTRLLKFIPPSAQNEFIIEYGKMTEKERKSALKLLDYFSALPRSTKKELTQNLDSALKFTTLTLSNLHQVQDYLKKANCISMYTNGCDRIFYKDNIVLVYGGGAVGPQCFPDPD